jgi:hypothetical protein
MKKFRIPRKIKKHLNGFFLYPSDEKGNSLMGNPTKYQENYTDYKKGILKDRFKKTKAQEKEDSIKWDQTYRAPIEITEEELLKAVNTVFGEEYRENAFKIFKMAKSHLVAYIDYYTFVNAYKLKDYSVSCMSLDSAEDNLRRSKPSLKKK